MRVITLMSAVIVTALCAVGCTTGAVVNTDDLSASAETSAAPPPSTPPPSNVNLVDAFDYVRHTDDKATYYFTTPSGRWQCAIVPRVTAGCQSTVSSGLGIPGEPDTVPDAGGELTTPNAIVVGREGDAHFAALAEPGFAPPTGTANKLQFNKILAAAGFRCNVQEAFGVSCLSELTGRGFTFSAEGFTVQYTDMPR